MNSGNLVDISYLRGLEVTNMALKSEVEALSNEGRDIYFFMQHKLDDNFERIVELEKRFVALEVDSVRVTVNQDESCVDKLEIFDNTKMQVERRLGDRMTEVGSLGALAEEKDVVEKRISDLTLAIDDDFRYFIDAAAEVDRLHVREKDSLKVSRV